MRAIAAVRLYDRLFSVPFPGDNLAKELNPESLKIVSRAALEPALAEAKPEERFQFERSGYFVADRVLSKPGAPVFNRTVTLRDSWAKLEQEALAALPRDDRRAVMRDTLIAVALAVVLRVAFALRRGRRRHDALPQRPARQRRHGRRRSRRRVAVEPKNRTATETCPYERAVPGAASIVVGTVHASSAGSTSAGRASSMRCCRSRTASSCASIS